MHLRTQKAINRNRTGLSKHGLCKEPIITYQSTNSTNLFTDLATKPGNTNEMPIGWQLAQAHGITITIWRLVSVRIGHWRVTCGRLVTVLQVNSSQSTTGDYLLSLTELAQNKMSHLYWYLYKYRDWTGWTSNSFRNQV